MSIDARELLIGLDDEGLNRANEYFLQFQDPILNGELGQRCNECGEYITGLLGLANFTAFGEGTCLECGHPFRYVHDIPGVGRLEGVPLMYAERHPHLATPPGMVLSVPAGFAADGRRIG